MRGERRRPGQVRLDDAEEVLVASGLVDADYVAAQLGTTFDVDSSRRPARPSHAGDVSPHPLFEAQWIGRRRSWQRVGQHPVLWYVSERRRRNRIAPHPLVDPRSSSRPTPRPGTTPTVRCPTGSPPPGRARPCRRGSCPRRCPGPPTAPPPSPPRPSGARRSCRERPQLVGPTPALPASLGTSPAVTVVMAAQDAGPLVHQTVASLQAQSFTDWHLVAVDRGSVDDTAAVLQGVAAFDDRVTVVRESRCGLARALNVALEHGTGEHVAFLPLGREWLPEMLGDLLAHAHHSGRLPPSWRAPALSADRATSCSAGARSTSRPRSCDETPSRTSGASTRASTGRWSATCCCGSRATTSRSRSTYPSCSGPTPPPPGFDDDWDSVVLERQLVDWDAAAARETDGRWSATSCRWARSRAGRSSGSARCRARARSWSSSASGCAGRTTSWPPPSPRSSRAPASSRSPRRSRCRSPPTSASSEAAGSTVVLVRPEAMPPRAADRRAARRGAACSPAWRWRSRSWSTWTAWCSAPAPASPRDNPHPELFLAGLPTSDAVRIGQCAVAAPASPLVALRTETARRAARTQRALPLRARRDRPRAAGAAGRPRRIGAWCPDAVITSRTAYADAEALIGAMSSLRATVLADPQPPADHSHAHLGACRARGDRRAQPDGQRRPRRPERARRSWCPSSSCGPCEGIRESPAAAAVGRRHRRSGRPARRPLGRHLLRPVAGRRPRTPRPARGDRPPRRPAPRLARPRRRAARRCAASTASRPGRGCSTSSGSSATPT